MARGKQTCKILKEIRRQIAEANGIEFITSECRYRGDCLGTCPKCEAEVRYLEQQLRAHSLAGKAVAIAGISAGMIALSGCANTGKQPGDGTSETLQGEPMEMVDTIEMLEGDVEMLEGDIEQGELPAIEDTVPHPVATPSATKEGEVPASQDKEVVVGEIIDPESENRIYDAIVDVRPTFPGGDVKLFEWISQHLVYPPNAIDSSIQGRVIIRFLIDQEGRVGDAEVIKGVDPDLDKEALRVVKSLPTFNPAMLNGKPIKYWFTLPITFKLTD